jgi:NAD(P)-dependent dehydrogenase (short-subunit alcohol dehydrogenase family)
VVITGASSGIGRASAKLLTERGAQVVLAARSEVALLEAQRDCREGQTLVVPTDVSHADQVDALMAKAVDRYGRVDAVVHSATVLAYGRFEDIPPEVFSTSVQVTVVGASNVARAALRQFERQGHGSLVVVGSLLGKIVAPFMSTYVTAKWALHGLVRCLQIEARQTPGVSISLVSPGGINTPVYTQAGTYLGRHGRPPPPVGKPEKVARIIVRRIDRPARDTSIGPANGLVVLAFRLLPGVFDRLVTPLMNVGGLERERVQDTPGNVLAPQPSGNAVHGRWGRHWLRWVAVGGTGSAAVAVANGQSRMARPFERQTRS